MSTSHTCTEYKIHSERDFALSPLSVSRKLAWFNWHRASFDNGGKEIILLYVYSGSLPQPPIKGGPSTALSPLFCRYRQKGFRKKRESAAEKKRRKKKLDPDYHPENFPRPGLEEVLLIKEAPPRTRQQNLDNPFG